MTARSFGLRLAKMKVWRDIVDGQQEAYAGQKTDSCRHDRPFVHMAAHIHAGY